METLEITSSAYEALDSHRLAGESFSDTILRLLADKEDEPLDAEQAVLTQVDGAGKLVSLDDIRAADADEEEKSPGVFSDQITTGSTKVKYDRRETDAYLEELDRMCADCGAALTIVVDQKGRFTGGHYFGQIIERHGERDEYWECDECFSKTD